MTDKKSSKAAKLRSFQDRFAKELPIRLDTIQQVWNAEKDIAIGGEFYRLVHSLVGSAGTFGFPLLGERARELELYMKQLNAAPVSSESLSVIEQGITELQKIAEEGSDNLVQANEPLLHSMPDSDEKQALIYVLEDDIDLAAEIAQQLVHFGYRVEVFHSAAELKIGAARQIPDVLLSDIYLPEGEDAGPLAAAELRRNTTHEVPVVFISGHDSWQDRLNAVRAGGQSYLSKPINFSLLLDELEVVVGKQQEIPYRILVVDDTVLLAEHYAAVLQTAGMQTEVLNKPEYLLEVLTTFQPDLILMDIYMPGCTGIEAAQVIHQHPVYTNLPIVYLSSEVALDKQLEAGGDGFLTKPISDIHLVTAVRNRARRFREMMALMNQDSLTGLLNHINLKLALEREISMVQRRASSLSFVMIDIDNFKSVNDTYGHPVGDTVIKSLGRLLTQRLRKGDIAARYGGEEFAVILPDTTIENAYDVIDDLRQQFEKINFMHKSGEFNVTFSAGIAECPPYKATGDLIAAADSALYEAKHAGRNQVHRKARE